jgi:CBS domain-containing protein
MRPNQFLPALVAVAVGAAAVALLTAGGFASLPLAIALVCPLVLVVALDGLHRGDTGGQGAGGHDRASGTDRSPDRWAHQPLREEVPAMPTMITTTSSRQTSLRELLGTVDGTMTSEVVLVAAHAPADVVVRRLEASRLSGAPVVDDRGRLIGVVTLRGLLTPLAPLGLTIGSFLRHEHHLAGTRVGDLMTREPAAAQLDWPLSRAVLRMEEARVNRLPVVDPKGKPVGILIRDDALAAMARRLPGQAAAHGSVVVAPD